MIKRDEYLKQWLDETVEQIETLKKQIEKMEDEKTEMYIKISIYQLPPVKVHYDNELIELSKRCEELEQEEDIKKKTIDKLKTLSQYIHNSLFL
jgi:hypothetical protein